MPRKSSAVKDFRLPTDGPDTRKVAERGDSRFNHAKKVQLPVASFVERVQVYCRENRSFVASAIQEFADGVLAVLRSDGRYILFVDEKHWIIQIGRVHVPSLEKTNIGVFIDQNPVFYEVVSGFGNVRVQAARVVAAKNQSRTWYDEIRNIEVPESFMPLPPRGSFQDRVRSYLRRSEHAFSSAYTMGKGLIAIETGEGAFELFVDQTLWQLAAGRQETFESIGRENDAIQLFAGTSIVTLDEMILRAHSILTPRQPNTYVASRGKHIRL